MEITITRSRFACVSVFLTFSNLILCSNGVPPHIIFIVVDDVGWNDVGWHNPEIKTPNLNHLVRNGININNSYVSPVCSPSRVALLTGRYPFKIGLQHGIITNDKPHGLPLTATILPEVLRRIGYSTHAVGKWHLGFCNWSYTPTYRGFDSFYGFYTGHQDHFTHRNAQAYDFRLNRDVHRTEEYSTATYAKRVVDIVMEHDTERPLFVYLAFQAAHPPLQVPKDYLQKYKFIKAGKRKLFSAMITVVDEAVGKIISALDERQMLGNTLFAFVSDNGASPENGGNNWPLRGGKGTLWEGGTRVPSFISGLQLPAKKLQGLFHAVDWFPTLVDAALSTSSPKDKKCIPQFPEIDGISHWNSLISRHKTTSRNSFVYQIDTMNGQAALRKGRFKIIEGCAGYSDERIPVPKNWNEESRTMRKLKTLRQIKKNVKNCSRSIKMYDMEEDEYEVHDLSNSPEHSNILMNLNKDLIRLKLQEAVPFNPIKVIGSHPRFWGGVWSPGWC